MFRCARDMYQQREAPGTCIHVHVGCDKRQGLAFMAVSAAECARTYCSRRSRRRRRLQSLLLTFFLLHLIISLSLTFLLGSALQHLSHPFPRLWPLHFTCPFFSFLFILPGARAPCRCDSASTPDRHQIDPRSIPHRSQIDPETAPSQHQIDFRSILKRPCINSRSTLD